jgi:beta-phosphoglucomutase
MTYKAILIDLDGTLVDSTGALYQAYLKFLEYFGKKGTRAEFQSLIGPSMDEIVEILQKKHELPKTDQNLSSLYFTMIVAQGFEGVELFPGVRELLKEAKKNKIKLGIVTSGTHALVKKCLDPLKVIEDFDVIITSEDVKKAKPHPEMYQLALKKLLVEPKDACAIEDSEAGKKAASDAGLKVIYITHGKEEDLKKDKKVVYLPNWKEIQLWLKPEHSK